MEKISENVFEFLTGQQTCTATLSSTKYVNKVLKLAKKYPDKFKLTAQNEDGSIVVRFPITLLTISSPRDKKQLSQEEREAIGERLHKSKSKSKTKSTKTK